MHAPYATCALFVDTKDPQAHDQVVSLGDSALGDHGAIAAYSLNRHNVAHTDRIGVRQAKAIAVRSMDVHG
jgi:hypothetical protein